MSQKTKMVDPLNPLSPEFLADPYPTFARFREEAPIFWSEKGKYWIATRYEDIHEILRDLSYEKQLQRWRQVNPLAKIIPPVQKLLKNRAVWMLNQDPPDHTRLRSLVNRAFTPKMVENMRDHIRDIANQLIDELGDKKEFDLVREYAFPLPVTVIAEMLGIPASDRDKFKEWSTKMTDTLEPGFNLNSMTQANHATEELVEYLKPLVAQRRKEPREDLISALVAAEEDGAKLTEEELLGNCILILVAGHETTVNLIGNATITFLRHPEQLEMIKNDPALVAGAINEVLRYESPVQMVRRLAGEPMEIAGQKIKEHDMLLLLLGSANRDPAMFADPDRFDIRRENSKKHLSFGHGIHHCLGFSLAEAEGQIAIRTLFERMPDLKMKDEHVQIRTPFALRGPKALTVVRG